MFFFLAFAISWAIWAPIFASAQGWVSWKVPYALYFLGSFGPLIAALIVTSSAEGWVGIRSLLGRWFVWRFGIRYYAFAILLPMVLFIIAILVNRLFVGV